MNTTLQDAPAHATAERWLYIAWDNHMLHAAPLAVVLPGQTTFAALRDQVLPRLYGEHPDFARIDWAQVQWLRGGAMFTPRMDATLAEHGCHHKTVLRWRTPGLQGLLGSHA